MAVQIAHFIVSDTPTSSCQSPAFPTLGEFSGQQADLVSDGDEARVCELDGECDDGARMIIETNAIGRQWNGSVAPPLNEQSATMFKCVMAKILVNTCGGVNRRIIDPGYAITMRGPKARVAVLIPAFGGAWDLSRGAPPEFIFEEAFEFKIFASACRVCHAHEGLPQLTWWRDVDAGQPFTDLTFVVPRGARSLVVGSVPAGPTTIQFWLGDPNVGASKQLGQQLINPSAVFQSPTPLENFGSPTHILFTPQPTAPGFLYMRWSIGD